MFPLAADGADFAEGTECPHPLVNRSTSTTDNSLVPTVIVARQLVHPHLYTSNTAVSNPFDRIWFSLTAQARAYSISLLAPTLVASLSLLGLIWAGYWAIRSPYMGLEAGFTGDGHVMDVMWVDPEGPAGGQLEAGEHITTLSGAPVRAYARELGLRAVGDRLSLGIRNDQGLERSIEIVLVSPITMRVLLDRLLPLVVSLAFWLSSLVVIAVCTRAGQSILISRLYFAFCQCLVVFIVALQVSLYVSEPAVRLMILSSVWMGTLAVDFHMHFPVAWSQTTWVRVSLGLAYGVAVVNTAVALLTPLSTDLSIAGEFMGIWMTACLLTVVVILGLALFQNARVDVAVQARLTALTALVGFLPALLLTLLPIFVLNAYNFAAPSLTFVFMGIVPIGYAYAILRYRLIRYDGAVSRAIGYVVAILAMVGVLIAMIVILFVSRIIPAGSMFLAAVVALTVVVAVVFEPARRRIQEVVDQIFERPWVEFRTTLVNVDETLAASPDVAVWAMAVCRQFATALDLTPIALLYRSSRETALRLAVFDSTGAVGSVPEEVDPGSSLMTRLMALEQPVRVRDLTAALLTPGASSSDEAWLASGAFDLGWPIRAHAQVKAVLLLGPRAGAFTDEEIELLALASTQIGAAFENVEYARELEQLSRAALKTRDDERRRVSLELHDHIIQPLVGLNFALATVRDVPQAAEAREQISDLITHVRRISADLRPPALDEVGLGAAVQGLTRTFARATGLQVDLAIRPDEDIEVPEPIASTIYSALREALNNIQKYAQATRVSVLLEVSAGQVLLVAHDDGVGFTLPDRLGKLATTGHFGLLGLQERLTAIDGILQIHTSPGQGTRLECRVPLPRL